MVHADAYEVNHYHDLVRHVARLSYLNKDHLVFFRGQAADYRNRRKGSTFYPSIFRGDHLRREAVEQRFELLKSGGRRLRDLFDSGQVEGHSDLGRRTIVQWSVLQHYEKAATPLLDLTQSLRVACSFAQSGEESHGYVFLFGLPQLSNRITVNSEHDLVVVRLLSICPPGALRPYFQEGYLAGTADITTEYEPKSELDFNRRLIAKFAIPNDDAFWGQGLSRVPEQELFPPDDSVRDLCELLDLTTPEAPSGSPELALGEFVAAWTALEQLLLSDAQRRRDRVPTLREAIDILERDGVIEPWVASQIHQLRIMRNKLMHPEDRDRPDDYVLLKAAEDIRKIRKELPRKRARDKRGDDVR